MTMTSGTQAEPTLAELLDDVWRARVVLLAGAVAGIVLALVFMTICVPQYRATMLVAPAASSIGADVNAPLPDKSVSVTQTVRTVPETINFGNYTQFEHTLRETSVAAALLRQPETMAGISKARRFIVGNAPSLETAEDLADYLRDHISIEPVGTTSLRRLVYKHPDRQFAVHMLRALHGVADDLIRQESRERIREREDYLQEVLESVDHPDHRRALTMLLMEQEHLEMILAMDEPFAAAIIEPPAAGTHPYWPRAAIVLPVFMLAGMMIGFVLHRVRREALQ